MDALEACAFHEAGHAVAALARGLHVTEVTIVPDTDAGSAGHCVTPWPDGFDEYDPDAKRRRAHLKPGLRGMPARDSLTDQVRCTADQDICVGCVCGNPMRSVVRVKLGAILVQKADNNRFRSRSVQVSGQKQCQQQCQIRPAAADAGARARSRKLL